MNERRALAAGSVPSHFDLPRLRGAVVLALLCIDPAAGSPRAFAVRQQQDYRKPLDPHSSHGVCWAHIRSRGVGVTHRTALGPHRQDVPHGTAQPGAGEASPSKPGGFTLVELPI
ncbi:hypothetical protein Sar04_48120 [Salinispora arenicola]|uniref:Secreted protein n=1 Tax=Salinispora arenicola TaxID=168697 RepID=A0ABQ4K0S3_SALAC|nr:hypothetical protein Sar04_48120 [Salinispora arenicola]